MNCGNLLFFSVGYLNYYCDVYEGSGTLPQFMHLLILKMCELGLIFLIHKLYELCTFFSPSISTYKHCGMHKKNCKPLSISASMNEKINQSEK